MITGGRQEKSLWAESNLAWGIQGRAYIETKVSPTTPTPTPARD